MLNGGANHKDIEGVGRACVNSIKKNNCLNNFEENLAGGRRQFQLIIIHA